MNNKNHLRVFDPAASKKGAFLLDEEGVKLILAAICFVALVAFVVYVYINYSQNKELDTAKASLAHFVSDINSGNSQELIYNPQDWILASFPEKVGGTYPSGGPSYNLVSLKQCTDNKWTHCICLCKSSGDSISTNPNTQIKYMTAPNAIVSSCNSQAICQESDFSINYLDTSSFNKFEYNGYLINHVPFTFVIYQNNKTIVLGR